MLCMGYSLDFRKRVLEIREKEKLSVAETAKRFGVGTASITRWIKRIEPCLKRNKPATKINMEKLKKDVEENPDSYLEERAKKFKVSASAIFYALQRLNIRYKKNFKTPQSRQRKKRSLSKKATGIWK